MKSEAQLRADPGLRAERMLFRNVPAAETTHVALEHAYRSPLRAERAGGDFAVARRRPDGTTTLMVTDLWAKSDEADHYTSHMKRAFNIISLTVQSPARILSMLNRVFSRELHVQCAPEGTASAVVVTWDGWGKLRYASAGTDAALLFRGSDYHRHLEATGPLLGLIENAEYEEQGLTFRFGDLLVACTDGITEARDDSHALLGTGGLATIMHKLIRANERPTCEDLMEHVAAWSGTEFYDDATVVFANFMPPERAVANISVSIWR
jgi:serine phosphatase RsbU (regulator of sigma subunit)